MILSASKAAGPHGAATMFWAGGFSTSGSMFILSRRRRLHASGYATVIALRLRGVLLLEWTGASDGR